MELQQLVYFRALAYGSSMQQAADQLHVSQSTISMSLKKLEQEYGLEFFDRVGRKLSLNENGRHLLKSAEIILDEIDLLHTILHTSAMELQTTINICADAIDYANEAAMLFEKSYPFFHIELNRMDNCAEQMLLPPQTDFVISLNPYLQNTEESILMIQEPMLVVTSDRIDHQREHHFSELDGCTLVTCRKGSALEQLISGFFHTARVRPAKTIHYADPESLMLTVATVGGISFIPRSIYQGLLHGIKSDQKLPIPDAMTIEEPFCSRTVFLGIMQKKHSSGARLFKDFMQRFAAETNRLGRCPTMEELNRSEYSPDTAMGA